MKKIFLVLLFIFINFSIVFGNTYEELSNELEPYRKTNNWIHVYMLSQFNDKIYLKFEIKDGLGMLINYSGNLDIKTLIEGEGIKIIGNIPNTVNILNGEGEMVLDLEKSYGIPIGNWVGFIIKSQKNDLVGDIFFYGNPKNDNFLYIKDYLSELIPKNSNKVNNPDNSIDKIDDKSIENILKSDSYIEDNIFPITSQIKTLKNISTNPYLISVNFLLALLYLLIFYFTAQLFNSYFEELSIKNKWNEKISNTFKKVIKLPLNKIYNFIIERGNSKIVSYLNKVKKYLIKYEHKIYIVIGFLALGIIGQIVVDDFDIFSLKGWITIVIMIFILAFITLFKDILLYILNKGKEKESLKLENIPIGFIFAGIVASLGRYIGMIPGVMFGNVIKLNSKSNITSRKTSKPTLLLKVLFIVFIVGIVSWILSDLFVSTSFTYKFLIVTYFGLVNDVFFALLPFGMLWGVYILRDPKIKIKWFIFTLIVFFFLLHTIINSDGDLDKLLKFNGNFKILLGILFFWILITGILYFINKKISKTI